MRILIATLALFTISILGSCRVVPDKSNPPHEAIDSEELSRLVINYSATLGDVCGLTLEDSRIVYCEEIKKIYLEYASQDLLTMCEARLLMVEVVEGFLSRLNNHTVLSFEVERFPFTADDLQVIINFESYYGMFVDPLYIGLIWLQNGCVRYYAFDIKNFDADWSHQRFEPYFKSRELALLKKEADIPFEERENPPRKVNSFIYDRYRPRLP